MKLVKAVNENDVKLKDVVVSLQQVDGKIEAIVITDSTGKYIRIVKDGTYSDTLKVLVEEPVEYEKAYKLTVKLEDGVSVFKFNNKDKLDSKISSLYLSEGEYSVEEILVEVSKNLLGQKEVIDLSDIPF